jgi:NTE family protein
MSRPGIVLSGGGARGAYEAGVLQWMLEALARRGGTWSAHAVCGTSVGAIHAAFLAGALHDPAGAARRIGEVWSDLSIDRVLRLGPAQAAGLWRVALGGAAGAGLFDARPLSALVGRAIDWPHLHDNVRRGVVGALTVTATHVPTGRPVVFLEAPPEHPDPVGSGRRVVVRRAAVAVPHVLASASIPLVFPPVKVQGDLYCDGGLRLNTPMGPAIRLGSDRLLVIALNTAREESGVPELGTGRYPGAPFLLGKMLNAFLLDHVAQDLENLDRVNRLLDDALAGGATLERMAAVARERGEPVHLPIRATALRPSEDLGALAGEHLRKLSWIGSAPVVHALLKLVDVGEGTGSDLASYLLFDQGYTRELLALGREDAERNADAIHAFLSG